MNSQRRGMTLIEMAWAITASAVLVGVLAWVVSRVQGTGTRASEHLTTLVSLERFSQQFRRDAHAAQGVELLDGKPDRLRLNVAGSPPIDYRLTATGVERLVSGDSPDTSAREWFSLLAFRPLAWRVDNSQHRVALALGRMTRGAQGDVPGGAFSVLAVWGSDERARQQVAGGSP